MAKSGASSGQIEAGSTIEVWSEVDEAAMQALLARRNRVSAAMVGATRGGSMTDASKRRFCVEEDDGQEEWSLAPGTKDAQKPVLVEPKAEVFLPKGVGSVARRGKVMITMDAWKKDKITFSKAVSMAECNEKMRKYLNFILGKFGDQACEEPPTQAVDPAMYLHQLPAEERVRAHFCTIEGCQ